MGTEGYKNSLPKEWIDCPPNGVQLIASKFMALKTPLSKKYDLKIPQGKRYYPERIFELGRKNNVNFGLWIDLTNTNRYYDSRDIKELDCHYVKFAVKGHGMCPTRREVQHFIDIIQDFLKKSFNKCIAVHCTHGFNRTGFFISAYLVECLNFNIGEAVEVFARARPPGIYRANYIKELFCRYGSSTDIPRLPSLPSWASPKYNKANIQKKRHKGECTKSNRR